MYNKCFLTAILAFLSCSVVLHAQPGAEIEVKKPKKYENRKLGSEKTGEKKFTLTRKLYQNTVTHYNYFFNANARLNDVVATAKNSFKENYSQLLPFYNYTLEQTSQSKQDLDSIVYKCTAGILLHDLRNSWIDNLYLALAKAYFFRNDLDSAALTLQYLNFSYAPKEDGGYDKPIGSNASNDNAEFSIATKEKNSIWTKLTSRPPSRNESFIWQIRTHIEKNELPEASGLIEILRHDPNFPKRLETSLNEVLAYWFYKQNLYDSSAMYLSKALNEATSKQEKARWEYLIAQMYQLANKDQEAVNFYNRSISHTTDPVLEVYARLNSIRINRGNQQNYIQQNIDALLKMAKRDKYESYRDILYYAAANIELERNNFANAQSDLLKSVNFSRANPVQRSQSFLLLADMNYKRANYIDAYNFYDSTDVNVLAKDEDKSRVTLRKPPLKTIAENTITVSAQDSLQALAKLPPEQRDAMLKKQVKQLRKAQGLKEEDTQSSNAAVTQAPDLFATNSRSGDFYFYNAAAKARGFSEFKARWGERPNVDNWRRKSAIDRQIQKLADVADVPDKAAVATQKADESSYEGLQQNIPLTEEKLAASNKSIMDALYSSGLTFINQLEEYGAAIHAFEELLRRFPDSQYKEEALFNLVYAYEKIGDKAKADQYKNQLMTTLPQNKFAKMLNGAGARKIDPEAVAATRKYEQIYNLFIEGNFAEAKNQKRLADSTYGRSFWTPQLLFIESIYYIKEKEDSTAIKVLGDLVKMYSDNPMAQRASTMIGVLKRRKEIEDYLTKLEVTRKVDKTTPVDYTLAQPTKPEVKPTTPPPVAKKDTAAAPPVVNKDVPVKKDTAVVAPATVKKDTTATAVQISPKKDRALVSLPAVDTQQIASNSPHVTTTTDTVAAILPAADNNNSGVAPPVTTIDTAANTSPALSGTNNPDAPPAVANNDKPAVPPAVVKKDTVAAPVVYKDFSFVASDPHYVVVLLNRVDPVYASEARNAFNRFNQEKYYGQKIDVSGLKLSDQYNVVLQGPFTDANAALTYIGNVQPVAKSRILPWLTAEKYSFLIISDANLEVLKANGDVDAYKVLMQKALPGKF